ncbi:hypothetical protein M231_00942 [Tremella mesenterica]|uniref:carnosine N-methyltransferase n=1 Tax=Tremella mesenterica TaxID=5217 RepID=A0A4V1M4V7_TREME|nr:hypothetical protein M231_00942 [Tremella mesenterica]
MSQFDSPEERHHWRSVVNAFDHYMRYHLSANQARRMSFLSLKSEDKILLDSLGYRDKLNAVDEAIRRNAEFIDEMLDDPLFNDFLIQDHEAPFENGAQLYPGDDHNHSQSHSQDHHSHSHDQDQDRHSHSHSHDPDDHAQTSTTHGHTHSHQTDNTTSASKETRLEQRESDSSQDKIRSTLRSLVRDWSAEGAEERRACYDPCLQALQRHYQRLSVVEKNRVKVLVPGCGLGRLALEIAARGFASEGNEFSVYQLLVSNYMLNQVTTPHQHTIYPHVHSWSNHLTTQNHLLRPISIPDVAASDLLSAGNNGPFSLSAGDFEDIYGPKAWENGEQRGSWGAVVTCFFLDCARNVVKYLRIIHELLAEDGIWINIGPLLWHYENSPVTSPEGEGSIELSLDEVKALARKIGFEMNDEKMIPTTYTSIAEGMLEYRYNAAFWTATKCKPPP